MATRSRHTDAVSSWKAVSHDPQSRSIADRVSAEVVSGPGVSRIGSVMRVSLVQEAVRQAACRRFAPAEGGVLEAAALQRAGALEHGISGRAQMRVHALQVPQDIQIQRIRFDRLRGPFAQACEVALGRGKLLLAQLRFRRDQAARDIDVPRHEYSNRERQAVEDILMKLDEIRLAFLREGDAAPDL